MTSPDSYQSGNGSIKIFNFNGKYFLQAFILVISLVFIKRDLVFVCMFNKRCTVSLN